jgi:hypothetical protein
MTCSCECEARTSDHGRHDGLGRPGGEDFAGDHCDSDGNGWESASDGVRASHSGSSRREAASAIDVESRGAALHASGTVRVHSSGDCPDVAGAPWVCEGGGHLPDVDEARWECETDGAGSRLDARCCREAGTAGVDQMRPTEHAEVFWLDRHWEAGIRRMWRLGESRRQRGNV